MSWKAEYVVLIIISTLVDYLVARKMPLVNSRTKKFLLSTSIIVNLGLLFAFKYLNFFNDSLRNLLMNFSINFTPLELNVLLPVGISFYTFQTLSYTIDVYKGKIKPENHLGIFAVYVSFFPQLVAGPIERAKNLIPQFKKKFDFDWQRTVSGLRLILWGMFKKVVIADRAAVIVNLVFNNVSQYSGTELLIATILFAFQIYCDFSGYSDIAIGSARIMGYDLMTNFKRPYFAKSIPDFWARWHISLSTWFKDYVYIPLGGNRVKVKRWLLNIMIVFLVSGLWHGANWTFVVWGALHGIGAIICTLLVKTRFKKLINWFTTITYVFFTWIFFRANNVSDAFTIINKIFTDRHALNWTITNTELTTIFSLIGILIFIDYLIEKNIQINNKPVIIRWFAYISMILAIIFLGVNEGTQFIYFQF